ncbi:MAG: nitrogenase component 1 [Lachnospiraceae bacterium]|nr:nitrogenase component 1 [Lachnospiraceae bacterium]
MIQNIEIPIREAEYPAPFAHALEFNPPAHGTWNIVHIGMNVPEAQQIYVCAVNCMRGVVLTAAEMNRAERFSFVILKEEDLIEGTVEDITIQGVADVLRKLPKLPPAVCLFTVCTHHFLGCDINRIYRELEEEFPEIDFIRGYMDPILQKEGLTPDQKLRISMYRVLKDAHTEKDSAALIGTNVSLADTCDLKRLLAAEGISFLQMPDTESYEEYVRLGEADLFLSVVPNGRLPVQLTAQRLGKKGLYLPMTFDYEEIKNQENVLLDWVEQRKRESPVKGMEVTDCNGSCLASGDRGATDREQWFSQEIAACEESLLQAKQLMGDAPVWIDYVVHPRPLGLAKLLLQHGFRVEKVFLNAVNTEEEAAFSWLQREAPELLLCSTIQPLNRIHPRKTREKTLAIGPQAAWFAGTGYFVNMVEGGNLQGFDGIRRMAQLMQEAWCEEKDTRDLVPRKGLGCESCV